MGSRQEKRLDEQRRRYDCPNCDVVMAERWHTPTDWYGDIYYARCGQCLTVFVLTSDGWEEASQHDER